MGGPNQRIQRMAHGVSNKEVAHSTADAPNVRAKSGGVLKGIRVRGVIVGALVFMVCFQVCKSVAAVLLVLIAHTAAQGARWWLPSLLAIGVSEAAGGYVAGRMSQANPVAAALVVGLLSVLPSAWFVFFVPDVGWAWWMGVIYLCFGLAGAVAGGTFARTRPAASSSVKCNTRPDAQLESGPGCGPAGRGRYQELVRRDVRGLRCR